MFEVGHGRLGGVSGGGDDIPQNCKSYITVAIPTSAP